LIARRAVLAQCAQSRAIAFNTGDCMRVSSVAVALAMTVAVAAGIGEAAPIAVGAGVEPIADGCASAGAATTADCGLFSLDPFSATAITGSFDFDNDVALFLFSLTTEATFSAVTSGFEQTGFDAQLGLFYGADTTVGGTLVPAGTIVQATFPGGGDATIPIKGRDLNPAVDPLDYDDVLPDPDFLPTFVLGPGTYVLALIEFPNNFVLGTGTDVDSLASGFASDAEEFRTPCVFSVACEFSLTVTAAPVNAEPVPEPATLLLIGVGLSALTIVRRRRVGARSNHP
jgi:hypothetical protein